MSKQLAINGGSPVHTTSWPTWPPKDPGYLENLAKVIESGIWGVGGPMTAKLSEDFRQVCEADYCVPSTSGTIGLELALRALGVGAGDEVIVPPYTFIATASSVISVNAIPIFADILPDTLCLDPAAAEAAITPQTKAIIAVHIGGMPADLKALKAVCKKHNLALIEDAAQAHGAVYSGRKVGAIGDIGSFSFQSSKNMTAGEGGITSTNDRALYGKAWSYMNVGRVPDGGWYDHRVMGMNYRMTEFQAALILRCMETYEDQMALRDQNAAHLRARLDAIEGIDAQAFSSGADRSAYHLFIFRYNREGFGGVSRDKFVKALSAEGIPVGPGYNPLYREGMFTAGWDPSRCPFSCKDYHGKVDYSKVECPVCEHICSDGSFWMGQSTLLGTTRDMDDVADAILKIKENADKL
ncbi:MAG: DegT/DnrJ/EryC1/StrS family aminotransferase [Armatimonadia bacterium]